jgi:hypothetical protein
VLWTKKLSNSLFSDKESRTISVAHGNSFKKSKKNSRYFVRLKNCEETKQKFTIRHDSCLKLRKQNLFGNTG